MSAKKKWLSLPEDVREMLIGNVFCANCMDEVTITDFEVKSSRGDVVLEGKCATCGNDVVRVVEM